MRILLGTLLVLVMGAGLLGCESEDSVFDEPERFWGWSWNPLESEIWSWEIWSWNPLESSCEKAVRKDLEAKCSRTCIGLVREDCLMQADWPGSYLQKQLGKSLFLIQVQCEGGREYEANRAAAVLECESGK